MQNISRNDRFLYITGLAIVAFLSCWRVLHFTFWIDDWLYLWQGIYDRVYLMRSWMHFGTSLEFFIFTKLFGTNPFFWQVVGIILRIIASYIVGEFAKILSSNKITGIYAGLLFAATAPGVEAVGWANTHVSIIEVILLGYAALRFVRFLDKPHKWDLIIIFECIVLGVLLDFVRAVPILVVLVAAWFFSKGKKGYNMAGVTIRRAIVFFLLVSPIFVYLMYSAFAGSPVGKILGRVAANPWLMQKYILYVGNYLATLWNMMIGWVHPVLADPGHGILHRIHERVVLVALVVWIVRIFGGFFRDKKANIRLYATTTAWMLGFAFIHWLFEPRNTYAAVHRYHVLPVAGFTILLAYGFTLIRRPWVSYVLFVIFIALHIFTANRMLIGESIFRSQRKVDAVWQYVDQEVSQNDNAKIFFFFGEQPVKEQIFQLSGAIPFAIKRKLSHKDEWPYIAQSYDDARSMICGTVPGRRQVSLSDTYGWNLDNAGNATSQSDEVRNTLRAEIAQKGC
jgi:hypothetical protein